MPKLLPLLFLCLWGGLAWPHSFPPQGGREKNVVCFAPPPLGRGWGGASPPGEGKGGATADTPARLLSELIRFRSESGHEGQIGAWFSQKCEALGLHVRRFSVEDSSYNFTASLYPLSAGKPNIVLMSHLDVVPVEDSTAWQHPAYGGGIVDSAVWGRGALDCKGLAVMQLYAMLSLLEHRAEPLPYNVTLLCVSGEETGGTNGAAIVASRHMRELFPIAVFGEGGAALHGAVPGKPELNLYAVSVAEKSNMWLKLDITFRGHGHGATAPSNYANKAMVKALTKLADVNTPILFTPTTRRMMRTFGTVIGGRQGFAIKHANWWVFRPVLRHLVNQEPLLQSLLTNTATLTHLSNPPGPVNQISTQATALLDCRLLPGTSRKRFLREVKYGLLQPKFDVTVLNENPEAEETSPENPFFKMTEKTVTEMDPNGRTIPILFPASSDNNYFRSQGIAVFGITPILADRPALESIHNANEHIPIKELNRGIRFYSILLRRAEMPKDVEPVVTGK